MQEAPSGASESTSAAQHATKKAPSGASESTSAAQHATKSSTPSGVSSAPLRRTCPPDHQREPLEQEYAHPITNESLRAGMCFRVTESDEFDDMLDTKSWPPSTGTAKKQTTHTTTKSGEVKENGGSPKDATNSRPNPALCPSPLMVQVRSWLSPESHPLCQKHQGEQLRLPTIVSQSSQPLNVP
eukprot:1193788-Prorocentrum_minimum.AAC.2